VTRYTTDIKSMPGSFGTNNLSVEWKEEKKKAAGDFIYWATVTGSG
jgi:hypothetical protein